MTEPTHVARMHSELSELTDRAEKLDAFIASNPVFKGLDSEEQHLMEQQLHHMRAYQRVLSMRLQGASADATGNEPLDDSGDNSPAPPHP